MLSLHPFHSNTSIEAANVAFLDLFPKELQTRNHKMSKTKLGKKYVGQYNASVSCPSRRRRLVSVTV